MTEKDQSLKTQVLVSNSNFDEKEPREHVWCDQEFFKDKKVDLNFSKVDFPKNTLQYTDQGSLATVKAKNII